jgi:hypothetical protein
MKWRQPTAVSIAAQSWTPQKLWTRVIHHGMGSMEFSAELASAGLSTI